MSFPNLSEGWRSSTSRLLALYSLLFATWCCLLMGVMYWKVSDYLDGLAQQGLLQRAHLFEQLSGQALEQALVGNKRYDVHGIDAYGLFALDGTPQYGQMHSIPAGLTLDGRIHHLGKRTGANGRSYGSSEALAMRTSDDRLLVLVRDNGSLMAVTRIILDALVWGVLLTVIPGLIGWHLLRRRPLRRIRTIQDSVERIVAGDLGQRLPLSVQRDELDMLASIVNAMLERIERLMHEVKGVCDNIAHDLRTPLTRLRAQLYRMRSQAEDDSAQALQLEHVLDETDLLMARFRALLRISELEDHQRRSGFVALDLAALLQEVHAFYVPLAEQKQQHLQLLLHDGLVPVPGDRGLMFEALGNLLSNAIKFTPERGRILLSAQPSADGALVQVQDSGPGVPEAERAAVFQRFYRSEAGETRAGFGLGLSIVAAITGLHGFEVALDSSPLGGARVRLHCGSGQVLL
ncbi:HAMP domain-containing sensor histidine kinase [Pseudoxanthomonas sp.]|uniref:sensor histidine kinase n=1 Tax=Pseudoxanthomonas sp. TaxID=1871049 RepID=UPI00260FDA43|nr:HAMP domain-containing sensor histidine kinase [Pseudoxanthomonas sp.]WDS37757.1 MAG: HAMP domain-containing sensor histidine kinase [Pseudoxanthomonas sp.]